MQVPVFSFPYKTKQTKNYIKNSYFLFSVDITSFLHRIFCNDIVKYDFCLSSSVLSRGLGLLDRNLY